LATAAIHSSTKTTFWGKFFGSKPKRGSFNKSDTKVLIEEISTLVTELKNYLFFGDEAKQQVVTTVGNDQDLRTALSGGLKSPAASIDAKIEHTRTDRKERQVTSEYVSKKIELLNRNIMNYKRIFEQLAQLADGPSFLLLDDLYLLRLGDQANVVDYFHRIAKNTDLWVKIGTIRHRSRWYIFGNPPIGMKLGDDAEEIDLYQVSENVTRMGIFKSVAT